MMAVRYSDFSGGAAAGSWGVGVGMVWSYARPMGMTCQGLQNDNQKLAIQTQFLSPSHLESFHTFNAPFR
jgi:hypothetical protein